MYIPIRQLSPLYPSAQVQVYPDFASVHTPSLAHGLLSHASSSAIENSITLLKLFSFVKRKSI